MSDAYDFDDDDPSPEAQEARERNQAEMRERERLRKEAEATRVRRRPLLQLLCAGLILAVWLFMRWGFGAPTTGAANVAHLVFFTFTATTIAFFISNATMAPTNGTSGALGLTVIWAIALAVICGVGIIAGFIVSAFSAEGTGTLNAVFSAVIELACIFLTVAL